MKESDKIFIEHLLSQINREALSLSASPTALQANTHAHNQLAQKIADWRGRLQRISKKINDNQGMQESRMQQLKSTHRDHRYAEKQSIDSNMDSIRQLKQKVSQAYQALITLLEAVMIPSEGEVLFNAVAQLRSIHDDQQKLVKLKHIVSLSGTTSAQTIIREANPHSHSSNASPMPSLLLSVSIIILVIERLITNRKIS